MAQAKSAQFSFSIASLKSSNFEFITFKDGAALRDKSNQRAARSYGVKRAIQAKRKKLADQLENFRNVTPRQILKGSLPSPTTTIDTGSLDPFHSLPVDSSRLQGLLEHGSARQAVEPVFSISNCHSFQNLHDMFPSGFADPALSNAIIFAILFAKSKYRFTVKCLEYQSRTIVHINRQLGRWSSVRSIEATIGAILLLIGAEWRLGVQSHAQMHLKGIHQLFKKCDAEQITLSAGIKRAIFWQDLNTAMITGTDCVLPREVFPEMQWKREPGCRSPHALPLGFKGMQGILGKAMVDILVEITHLQLICESAAFVSNQSTWILHIDNQQARIESRSHSLLRATGESCNMLTCIALASYLYTYSLFTEVWEGYLIPSRVSTQLLCHLQASENESWQNQGSLLLWCVMIGGALSQPGATRRGYVVLMQSLFQGRHGFIFSSWSGVELILESFIWSSTYFGSRGKAFWDACFSVDSHSMPQSGIETFPYQERSITAIEWPL